MKREKFQNWDTFNSDDWIPEGKHTLYISTEDWNILAYFGYDEEHRQLEIAIKESVPIPLNTDNGRWYSDSVRAVNKQLTEWGLDPYRVSWVYQPAYFRLDGNYYSYLQEVLNPCPRMYFCTTEDNEVAMIDSKYSIIHEGKEIKLRFNQFIYNDNEKPIKLWNEFLKLARKRIQIPFTATLRLPEEEDYE